MILSYVVPESHKRCAERPPQGPIIQTRTFDLKTFCASLYGLPTVYQTVSEEFVYSQAFCKLAHPRNNHWPVIPDEERTVSEIAEPY